MFGNKSRSHNNNQHIDTHNVRETRDNFNNHKNKDQWTILSGYISSAVTSSQDAYGAPIVNFKIVIPLKHPTQIHYGYYSVTGSDGRRIPEIQTETIDHWDYACTKYSQNPTAEVHNLYRQKGKLAEVTGHRSEGTFKLKKNGLSIKSDTNGEQN